jgi:hypothetical protein
MTLHARSGALAALLLVAGCAPKQAARPATGPAPIQVQTYTATGLQAVLGRTARVLEGQFGRPELDIREGTARKLQFSAPACVLDAYLYPPAGGGEPIVTHLDARLPDGWDFDRASCVAALLQARK